MEKASVGGLMGPIEESILILDYLKPLELIAPSSMIPHGGERDKNNGRGSCLVLVVTATNEDKGKK
jgi:hypothetical protein